MQKISKVAYILDPSSNPRNYHNPLELNDKQAIRETLGALIRHGSPAQLHWKKKQFSMEPIAYSADLDLLQWKLPKDFPVDFIRHSPCTIAMHGHNTLYTFKLHNFLIHGHERLSMEIPHSVKLTQNRLHRRQRVENLKVVVTPMGASAGETCQMRDISYGGFSIYVEALQAKPGQFVQAEIKLEDDREIHIVAKLVKLTETKKHLLCHFHIPSSLIHSNEWMDFANEHLYPRTKTGDSYCEENWKLYTNCGYFNLSNKSPADFETLKNSYEKVITKLDKVPQLGSQIVWPNKQVTQGMNATFSALKTYQHSWFFYHMARINGNTNDGISGRRVLRELSLRAYDHAKQDPEFQWSIAYLQVRKVWGRMAYFDFVLKHVDNKEADIVRFRALQYNTIQTITTALPETIDVQFANQNDLEQIAILISKQRSTVYCEALDLVPQRMKMKMLHSLYNKANLHHKREVLFIRNNGQIKAAAVLETTSNGLHLFGLLDLVRLYSFSRDGEKLYPSLLSECSTWFKNKNKKHFCVFLENEQKLDYKTKSLAKDMGLTDMAILSTKHLPEYFEYLHQVTAPRPKMIEMSHPDPQ